MQSIRRNLYHLLHFWLKPAFPFPNLSKVAKNYSNYLKSWREYNRLQREDPLLFENSFPCLFDAVANTPFDSHYFYQSVWAFERAIRYQSEFHVDVGSDNRFVSVLSTIRPVVFLDIRPLKVELRNFKNLSASILSLPFKDQSIPSLSCLHVLEHIGLGRYGDPLNPSGTRQSCTELSRVLAPGGNLLVSLPIGKPRIQFNAHRIHSPIQICDYFQDLELIEFSYVDDLGKLYIDANPSDVEEMKYSCGLFWFASKGAKYTANSSE